MALTKAEMAERLYEEVGLNKREAKEFVDAFFDALREALEHGRQVKLSGFGNFDLRRKNQRPGRNPKTGEQIPISARTVVTFRPGQKLNQLVVMIEGSPIERKYYQRLKEKGRVQGILLDLVQNNRKEKVA